MNVETYSESVGNAYAEQARGDGHIQKKITLKVFLKLTFEYEWATNIPTIVVVPYLHSNAIQAVSFTE